MSYFVSWSGGKDSCLAMCHAYDKYGNPSFLLNMVDEYGENSRSHGLSKAVLQAQAVRLDVPIVFYSATWKNYEKEFSNAMEFFKSKNIKTGVFGDLKIADKPEWTASLDWVNKMCEKHTFNVYEPLWDYSPDELFELYFNSGIKAKIVSVNTKYVGSENLGKILTKDLALFFQKNGVDPFGEKGEFHTFVTNCPLFSSEIKTEDLSVHKELDYKFLKIKGI
jgi:diphthine-ammonia ligase